MTTTPPTIERHFAAVRVTSGPHDYYLNRARLRDAIQYLSKPSLSYPPAKRLYHKYPALTPAQVREYLHAAQLCIDHNIRP